MSQGIELQPRHLLPLQKDQGGDLTFQKISRERPVWSISGVPREKGVA